MRLSKKICKKCKAKWNEPWNEKDELRWTKSHWVSCPMELSMCEVEANQSRCKYKLEHLVMDEENETK